MVGGRLYHVITDWQLYFPDNPWASLYVWRGGLGIWGAIALGAVGVVIGARRKGIRLLPVLDAIAPGVLVAQALGRWGNYFNQELFGRPTDLPWALEIDPAFRPEGYYDVATFHPTFLYEFLWCLAAFVVVVWADRRFQLGHGRVVALYVMAYTAGRGWIEALRIDDVQMDDVFGLRLNVWTSIVLFVAAAVYFVWSARRHPGRETVVYVGRLPGRRSRTTSVRRARRAGVRPAPSGRRAREPPPLRRPGRRVAARRGDRGLRHARRRPRARACPRGARRAGALRRPGDSVAARLGPTSSPASHPRTT